MAISGVGCNYNGYTGYNAADSYSNIEKADQQTVNLENEQSEYLSKLQGKYKSLTITVSNSIPNIFSKQGTDKNLSIHPSILREMQNNPEKAQYYEQRIRDIEGAMNWTIGLCERLGFQYNKTFAYIDENGELWGGGIHIRKDMLNEKLREESKERTEKFIEESRMKSNKNRTDMEDRLKGKLAEVLKNKEVKIEFNNDEMNEIIKKSKGKKLAKFKNEQENVYTYKNAVNVSISKEALELGGNPF